MDSGDYSPPPSFSSGGTRSLNPQFPEYYQPTDAVDQYGTQPPSISSTGIKTSEPQFTTSGQGTVADVSHDQAPSYSALQQGVGNSINVFSGGNADRGLNQTDYGAEAPNLDAVVHENNSATGFIGYSDYEQPPSYSDVAPRDPSNPFVSTALPTFNPQDTAGFSIVGGNFRRGNLMDPYN